jgi:hypothetical protein
MIVSILKFLRGEVYKVNQTAKKVYLSDDTSWNLHLFHQNLNIVRSLISKQATDYLLKDEYILTLNHAIKQGIIRQELILKETNDLENHYKNEKNRVEVLFTEIPGRILETSKKRMPFGKYKGSTISEIYAEDPKYMKWLLTHTNFKLGSI